MRTLACLVAITVSLCWNTTGCIAQQVSEPATLGPNGDIYDATMPEDDREREVGEFIYDYEELVAGNSDWGIVTASIAIGFTVAMITIVSLLSFFVQKVRPQYRRWITGACVLGILVVAGALVLRPGEPGLYRHRVTLPVCVGIISFVVSTFSLQATNASRAILGPNALSVCACLLTMFLWYEFMGFSVRLFVPAIGISELGVKTIRMQSSMTADNFVLTCVFAVYATARAIVARVFAASTKSA